MCMSCQHEKSSKNGVLALNIPIFFRCAPNHGGHAVGRDQTTSVVMVLSLVSVSAYHIIL